MKSKKLSTMDLPIMKWYNKINILKLGYYFFIYFVLCMKQHDFDWRL